jgi:hypothetical protein
MQEGTLYDPRTSPGPPRQPGAARAQAVPARPRLHRQGGEGRHHRRVHRPHDAEGRRYSEGLHQALRSQGGLRIQPENQTLASITFQNYFRLYDKLAGMTGTARPRPKNSWTSTSWTWSKSRPTCRSQRIDEDDEVYRTADEKFAAIVEAIEARKRGQPVLVGTTIDREVRDAAGRAEEAQGTGHPAQCAERPLPRAGSADHRPGRRARRGHHRHQHGRPRHRHPARRQRRHARRHRTWRHARGAGA